MEENKQNLEFITPEVKVVSVTSQRVLCQSQDTQAEADQIRQFDGSGMTSYGMVDF